MKNEFFHVVSIFIVTAFLSSCHLFEKHIEPSSPNVKIDTANFRRPSMISIPIEINLKPAFALAEKQLPEALGAAEYNEWFGTGGADACPHGVGCGYSVTRAPLNFNMNGNILRTNLSIAYGLSCRTRLPDCHGFTAPFSCNNRHAHGSLSTSINIDNSWNCSTSTKNNGMIADDDCKVGVLGFINVTDKVMNGFNAAFDKAAQTLDAKINEDLNSRQRITKAWQKISEPFPIKDLGWFYLSPDSIRLSAFTLEDNTVKVNLFLKADPEIYFGEPPAVKTKPLPDNGSFTENNSLNILLPISTDYAFVENQLKKNLKIQERGIRYPPTGNKYIKITNINVYGYGRKIVVRISFNGTKSGYAYLEGTPTYDVLTNILSFPDLDYSIDTKSLMLKAIDFFKHDDFIRDLRNRLTVNLNSKVTQLKDKVTEALNKKYKDFTLQGDVSNLRVLGLYCDQDKNLFTAYFEINGSLKVGMF
jgi:hypothetical protein